MSKLAINRIPKAEDRSLPIFDEIDQITQRIKKHAFELFADRGFMPGQDLEDWLSAEKEICWSPSELIEDKTSFILKIALAGYEPEDISVTASPRELIIKGTRKTERTEPREGEETRVRWSEFLSDDIYRRVEFPVDVDIDGITAEFKRGLLSIRAPKLLKEKAKAKDIEIVTSV